MIIMPVRRGFLGRREGQPQDAHPLRTAIDVGRRVALTTHAAWALLQGDDDVLPDWSS
jgi:hypothetical protein